MTSKTYAGIGSRNTPMDALQSMTQIAATLACSGWLLRSGGANGADSAFETGAISAKGEMEIFLPWKGFNGRSSPWCFPPLIAYEKAAELHPAWERLGRGPRALMARNVQQILGHDPSRPNPVEFVICWTPDGCESDRTRTRETGGTGQAISLASKYGVPIFNLKNPDAQQRLDDFIQQRRMRTSFSP